jgi:hypothetical protein
MRYLAAAFVLFAFAALASAQVVPPTPTPMPSPSPPAPTQPAPTQPAPTQPVNKGIAIELPPDMTVSGKQRSVKIVARTAGAEVMWIVFNSVVDIPVDFDAIDGKTLRLYPNDVDDLIVVFAYT